MSDEILSTEVQQCYQNLQDDIAIHSAKSETCSNFAHSLISQIKVYERRLPNKLIDCLGERTAVCYFAMLLCIKDGDFYYSDITGLYRIHVDKIKAKLKGACDFKLKKELERLQRLGLILEFTHADPNTNERWVKFAPAEAIHDRAYWGIEPYYTSELQSLWSRLNDNK